jgi:hypothetical protein
VAAGISGSSVRGPEAAAGRVRHDDERDAEMMVKLKVGPGLPTAGELNS